MATEFWPRDRWPKALVPKRSRILRAICWVTGGHTWRKFIWGGVYRPTDCDCCMKCHKFRGPLPVDRDTEIMPSVLWP